MSYKVKFVTKAKADVTILEIAKKYNIKIKSPCKKGKCGKCLVKVSGELAELTKEEKKTLTSKEIEEGYRLACMAKIKGPVNIELD